MFYCTFDETSMLREVDPNMTHDSLSIDAGEQKKIVQLAPHSKTGLTNH